MLNTQFWMYAGWGWGFEGKINKMGMGGLNVIDSELWLPTGSYFYHNKCPSNLQNFSNTVFRIPVPSQVIQVRITGILWKAPSGIQW